MIALLRLCLLLGVILGVVLPKSSAALADLGLINARTVVICTGQGLEVITLTADGTPAEDMPAATHDEPPCLLVHTLDGVIAPPPPVWVALAREFHPADTTHLWSGDAIFRTGFARAPPRA